ncbi:Choline transporter protein [Phytophthora cinnamomi]|uniref:Choline transporter protein n=1 Tax=Phytophthora cinnamomi TaxID=4785 RepID=UPI0035597C53|nr:Choline transporter protein [Phytophthora cinnamomi]
MAGKRKRGDAFSAHEKLVHKSCSLVQREAKKVRTFLVRKAVQQLKQLRQQLAEPVADEAKRQKRELKLRHSIERFEREHAALKTLDLLKLVARARAQTGLDKPQLQLSAEEIDEHEHEEAQDWDEEGSDSDSEDEQLSGSEEEQEREAATAEEEKQVEKEEEEDAAAEQEAKQDAEQTTAAKQDEELENRLMDRVLAHKQIVPLLDAITKLVEKEEKEAEKKRRAQEKRALKRGRHESLVGNTGRSGVVPTSLFLGSLSGRGGTDDLDMGMDEYGTMAGADDDIAEFLGEKKKKKNRPGQMARRMKAIRKEEALKRKEDRAKGIFVPYKDNSAAVGKYGLSERPKKAKPKAKSGKQQGDKKASNSGKPRASSKEAAPQKQRAAPAPAAPVEAAHPSWLAKQKQKEKEKVSLTAFSGKKITFD